MSWIRRAVEAMRRIWPELKGDLKWALGSWARPADRESRWEQ